ncbi:hypothetical protein QNO07_04735 [Streptomyces sp. 549]|uniref:hypothetical protein n=1 Tax=Streptomyces sp. 549 TaxID=3049076 RepID=UPI0024C3DF4F|nr:hypothetical protein [Streptomyces sp. 549]MDK1472739.1 hypothetical protein [Streptomyces sp. 549]
MRTLVTLKNPSAPSEYRFRVEPQPGVGLVEDGAGGFLLARDPQDGVGEVVGALEAPWAKDANGRPVPTSYRLEGNTVIQTVETSRDTAFPVVADPKITFGAGIYFNAWGAEWKAYTIAAGSVAYFANVAGCAFTDKVPHLVLKRAATVICSAVGYKTLKDWGTFLRTTIKDKKLIGGACYQTRLTPKNSKLTKVSAGNCK